MTPVRYVVYCHGFASSPASSKARRFEQELLDRGVGFSCPDFNLPDFSSLTTTRMLGQVKAAVAAAPEGPVALVGSSLGAFVAVHAADEDETGRIDRLVLLAPALDFGGNRLRQLGEHGIEEWRQSGKLRIHHYGWNEERDVWYTLFEDAARYDAFGIESRLPMLIFQGEQDESVDPGMVARWAAPRPTADLRLVADGHQLTSSMDMIWRESARFFSF